MGFTSLTLNNHIVTTASNKILEYMAAGLPLLLSDTSGSHSLLGKYHNVVLAEVIHVKSVAEAVNRVLSDDSLARSMGKNSRRAFTEEYNYEHQYAPALERFRVLATNRKR